MPVRPKITRAVVPAQRTPAPRTPAPHTPAPHTPAPRTPAAGDDVRARTDGLGWVTRAVFGDPRLRLEVDGPTAGGLRYAVVPDLDRARFLLPLAARRAAAASVLAYNALRPPRVRASRLAIGALAGVGALGRARFPVLAVHVADGVDPAEVLVTEHLAALLGGRRLHAAIGVRPPDPHHKPTLQLFDDAGRPRGYAKLGWNDGTRAMVRREAATLPTLPGAGGGFPTVPRLILHTRWQGARIAVVEPMPRRVHRIRRPDAVLAEAMLAVARRAGAPAPDRPLRGAPLLDAWRARSVGAPAVLTALIDALVARDGEVTCEFGDWHGDWVPWNMARHRGRLYVWDWENHGRPAPVGFDLAHQAFQIALSLRGRDAAGAAAAARQALRRHGPALGLGPRRQDLVADAYLIELWLRTYELSAGGAGWNDRLHPALLHVLGARLGVPTDGMVDAVPPG